MIRIALIDDHNLVLQSLADKLDTVVDLKVVGRFTKQEQLLTFLKKQQLDLLIMDFMLTEGTAFELIAEINSLNLSLTPKYMILSGFYNELLHQQAIDLGVRAFIRKEASYEELIAAVKSVSHGNIIVPATVYSHQNDNLSEIELKILDLMVAEKTNQEIASELFISRRTVETHITNICRKLQVNGRIGAVREAVKNNLV